MAARSRAAQHLTLYPDDKAILLGRKVYVGVQGLNETVDAELLADTRIMKLENDPILGRQLESINQGRAWTFGHGVRTLVW